MRERTAIRHRAILFALVAVVASGCRSCASCRDDDESEEEEERDRVRDHFWRARIAIEGQGRVKTFVDAFDCASDGRVQTGACGPLLVRFKELAPATMHATPAPGWAFDRWESVLLAPDGGERKRAGRMPDGPVYLNGFGFTDTGELETVKAVFVPDG